MKKTIFYTGLTIILFVIGFYSSQPFFYLSVLEMNLEEIELIANSKITLFHNNLIFTIAIGLIPLLYLFAKIIAKTKSNQQSLKMLGIIIISGIVFWQMRIFHVIHLIKYPAEVWVGHHKMVFGIEGLKFEIWLTIGLFFGTILNIVIFRRINKRSED